MKTVSLALVFMSIPALVLLGCSDNSNPVVSPVKNHAPPSKAALGKAAVVHQEWKEFWSYYGPVEWYPCLGEGIQLSGTYHFVIQTVLDGKGGYHSTWHYNRQNVVGVGDGGTIYHQTGGGTGTVNSTGQVGEVQIWSETVNFIGQGGGKTNDYTIKLALRYVVNANGEVKVDYNPGFIEGCK